MCRQVLKLQNIPFLFIIIGFAICFFCYPRALDDYWFLYDYKCGLADDDSGSLFDGLKSFWSFRIFNDNGRLCNMIGISFLLIPRWIGALITTITFVIGIYLMCRLAKVRPDDYNSIGLLFLMITFGLPWHDSIFTTVYTFNYIWDIPIMLWCILLFFSKKTHGGAMMFVWGLILGAWHEIYSLPVLIAFIALFVLRLVPARKDRLFLIAGLIAGLAWLMLILAWSQRVGNDIGWNHTLTSFIQLGYHYMGFFPFLCLLIICASVRKWRKMISDPLVVLIFVACVTIICVQVTVRQARAGFPAYILGFVGVVYLLRHMLPRVFVGNNSKIRWITLAVSLFMCAHIVAADCEVIRLNKEITAIEKVYVKHTERPVTIFADMTFDWQLSPLAFKKGTFEYHPHGWQYICYTHFTGTPLHDLVPMQLKGYKAGMGELLPGSAGARLYKGVIVAPYPGKDKGIAVFYAGNDRGGDISVFRGGDGKQYCFVYPYLHTWDYVRKISKVDVVDR